MRRFISLIAVSSVVLSLSAGCASRAAAPTQPATTTTNADIDTSDPSWAPPQDGFVMVQKPEAAAKDDKKSGPTAAALPSPNARAAAGPGSIHAATN